MSRLVDRLGGQVEFLVMLVLSIAIFVGGIALYVSAPDQRDYVFAIVAFTGFVLVGVIVTLLLMLGEE